MQRTLSSKQIAAFYHRHFVEDQAGDFLALVDPAMGADRVVVDVGGGCGFFAQRLTELTHRQIRVIDTDPGSVKACTSSGVEAVRGDALSPQIVGDEGIVCFNLILHHLVGPSERDTRDLQRKALAVWRNHTRAVFVNEYIYESYVATLSGWLIYQITKSRFLSWIGRAVSTVVPSLKANTFGVGVRFRAHREWVRLFASAGYEVKSRVTGREERVRPPLRLLLIRRIRRDSFLLHPRRAG
jgi:hypothetical protein